jgi:hypothetical protein
MQKVVISTPLESGLEELLATPRYAGHHVAAATDSP